MCDYKISFMSPEGSLANDGKPVLGFFFFFQAEDGIRDHCVTGVQTCALPISRLHVRGGVNCKGDFAARRRQRSEERRVGKSVDLGGRRIIKKKKKNKRRCGEYQSKKKKHKYKIRNTTLSS